MSFTLSEIIPEGQIPRTAQSHEGVGEVLGIMQQHGFDQIPVVNVDGVSLKQVVTHQAILQGIQAFDTKVSMLQVKDVASNVRTYHRDADLLDTLDDIQRNNFAIIVNEEDKITGIVTTADTTVFFREYAQDLMRIEGLEALIKEAILALYANDNTSLTTAIESVTDRASETRKRIPPAIKAYLNKAGYSSNEPANHKEAISEAERVLSLPKPGKAFEMLSFDEFVHVLLMHPQAPRLSNATGVDEVRRMFNKVRDARNKLAHFRGELTSEERNAVQLAEGWLERNLPSPRPIEAAPLQRVEPTVEEREDEIQGGGSYAALSRYLAEMKKSVESVVLRFEEIESILGRELPRSAYEYRAWWANDNSHPQASSWLDEGWKTRSVSMSARTLSLVRTSDLNDAYIKFFGQLLARLREHSPFQVKPLSPHGNSYQRLVSLDTTKPEGVSVNACFTRRKQFRVEVYIDYGQAAKNKALFDRLLKDQARYETIVSEPLTWERLNDRRACRIAFYTPGQVLNTEDHERLIEWGVRKASALYIAFSHEFGSSDS